MSPVQRVASGFGVLLTLAALNFGFFLYLACAPRSTFENAGSWSGVLGVTPFHDPRLFGFAFGSIAVGLLVPKYIVNVVALYVGVMTWCVLGASHLGFALSSWPEVLGFGFGLLGVFSAAAHFFILKHRR